MPSLLRSFQVALCVLATASPSLAAPPKPKPKTNGAASAPAQPKKADLARWQHALEAGSEAEALPALEAIGALGKAAAPAAPLVDALLARGSGMRVLIAALDTEARLAVPASSGAVAPYVQHRNAEIRRAAATALGQTGGPAAITELRKALTGPDPAVRAIAATGLGNLGAKESVDALFVVLAHDTPEAAVAIARLCSPAQCDRLMALVGKLKFEVLEASFIPLLFRPEDELPEENRLAYVDRLRRLATRPAANVLQTALVQLPKDEHPRLRAALQAALKARPIVGDRQ